MSKLFGFGETIAGYDVPVLDEREVRAAAGILFFFALVSFMNSWLMGNFRLTQIFVVAFLIDFAIRIFVNPRYAPSMILGGFAVRKQVPEWAGASQKRFAWSVGFVLAVTMFYLIVIENVIGPINLFVCAACLTLMFFESAFGICLACKVYNLFTRNTARHCPGGVCEVDPARTGRALGPGQATIVTAFLGAMMYVGTQVFPPAEAITAPAEANTAVNPDCVPPDWAVAMGHADMWKLHHNCK
jgi:hypothetical protein